MTHYVPSRGKNATRGNHSCLRPQFISREWSALRHKHHFMRLPSCRSSTIPGGALALRKVGVFYGVVHGRPGSDVTGSPLSPRSWIIVRRQDSPPGFAVRILRQEPSLEPLRLTVHQASFWESCIGVKEVLEIEPGKLPGIGIFTALLFSTL